MLKGIAQRSSPVITFRAGTQISLIHTTCEGHKTLIEKATALYNYDINAGWPEVFK